MFSVNILNVGFFYSDAGASLGNLPRAIWGRFLPVDEKHRLKLNLNLLLIQDGARVILVDTGMGNKLNAKMQEIFALSSISFESALAKHNLTPDDITDVIMTHLHQDHAGGIVSFTESGEEHLTFPNATYHIQKQEWEMAKEPDILNRAAYNYEINLKLLDTSGKLNLITGEYKLTANVSMMHVGGHSEGAQIVLVNHAEHKLIYPGDIIPSPIFLKVPITSAYEVCRRDTVKAKLWILDKVESEGYTLIYDHSTEELHYAKKN